MNTIKLFSWPWILVTPALAALVVQDASASGGQDELAGRLPHDLALLVSIDDPRQIWKTFLDKATSPDLDWAEFAMLVLTTDPRDGSEKPIPSEHQDGLWDGLSNLESVHLVVSNSRDRIGDAALILERKNDHEEISEVLFERSLGVIEQIWSMRDQNQRYFPLGFDAVLARWKKGLSISSSGEWVIVSTRDEFGTELLGGIQNPETISRKLSDDRGFQGSQGSWLDEANVRSYLSYRNGKQILIKLGYTSTENWEKQQLDGVPWSSMSIRIRDGDDSISVDRKSVIASTFPPSGDTAIWKHCLPIEEFPAWPESVNRVTGKNLNVEACNDYTRELLGDEFRQFEQDPLTAFEIGLNRPRLGNLKFEMRFKNTDLHPRLTLLRIEPNTANEAVLEYLRPYYNALQDSSRWQMFETDYQETTIQGRPAFWSHVYRAKENQSGTATSSKQNGTSDHSKEQEQAGETTGVPSSDQNRGLGAVLVDGWVVIGGLEQIDQLVNWQTGRIQTDNRIRNLIDIQRKLFELPTMPYSFQIAKNESVVGHFNILDRVLFRALPVGWPVRTGVFEAVRADPSKVDNLNRTQQARFHLHQWIEWMGRNELLYIRTDALPTDFSRQLFCESWTLSAEIKPRRAADRNR